MIQVLFMKMGKPDVFLHGFAVNLSVLLFLIG